MVLAAGLVVAGCRGSSQNVSSEPTAEPLAEPPALVVGAGSSRVVSPGINYCWTTSASGEGVCADSFGNEVPTPVDVDTATVSVAWVEDGTLSASLWADGQACPIPLARQSEESGHWTLALPAEPGTYRVDLFGSAPEGRTQFAILVTSASEGPAAVPIVSAWWPDTSDDFALSVEVEGLSAASEAALEIVSAGDKQTLLPVVLRASEAQCRSVLEGEAIVAGGIEALGVAPYTATLVVTSYLETWQLTWEWPLDHRHDDKFEGTSSSYLDDRQG